MTINYKGVNIIITDKNSAGYAVDIKRRCGDFIWGYEFVSTSDAALRKAVEFVDLMAVRGY